MVTLNAAFLQAQFNDSNISAAHAEGVLDGAINMLNTFGAELDNLTGEAESKTGTYTSRETGGIMAMAQQIYEKHYKHATSSSVGVGGITRSYAGDTQLLMFAEKIAERLKAANLAFVIAEDTSGLT